MGGLLTLGFLQLLARMQHSQMLEVYAMRETSVIQHGRTTAAACSIPAACSAAFKASGYSGTFGTSHMAPCCTAWPAGVGQAWRERRVPACLCLQVQRSDWHCACCKRREPVRRGMVHRLPISVIGCWARRPDTLLEVAVPAWFATLV